MKRVIGAALLGMAALPLTAGAALAAEEVPNTDVPSQEAPTQEAQSPLQGASAGAATGEQLVAQFLDASDGNGPTAADGVETEVPTPDYRFVEGPAGGLLDGPFD
ncbi:hypothetical protein [Pseudonocardia pini]|uniref:hypothetical protein n=1 Tax=Pseudonocardia pini TaxID=2758030 RepID=UPI0015F07165|nr:hypothetical protein [Pseudonocardia pini]